MLSSTHNIATINEETVVHENPRNFRASIQYVHKFTKEILSEFEDAYELACTEDGFLHVDKISSILQAFGIEVSRSYYEEVLENQTSGYIDFDKMLAIISVCVDQSGWMLHEMQESFNIFDKDGNGSLDATELKRVFIKLGEHLTDKQMEDQIKDFDIDHDNEMNLAEYLIMTQQTKGIDFGLDT